ncbi:TetR/AcrR family transcriptional regulator [Streptomyces sp. UNOB3_S3]|uniref:TetR/AcrR family transcriptional regulator n=1 Tax=Streptomyces sp. UNOB3_S3 TaxID=2871682 RepID=UPI001E48F5C5|nr:TetR/AcrR family transcriptional regulator [Streptomyces sp. UNOB3_S3]MCC3778219.1 TetR/AcrR family transcriptional regulator [Streptomyces sp. UNOB3_S3]
MPKSPTKTRPQTVGKLRESARALFTDKGFHATSISDICEGAGLTRGAFYSNFRDKEELFLALYDDHAERLVAGVDAALAALPEGADPFAVLLEHLAARGEESRRWFLASMEFTLQAMRDPALARELATHEERVITALTGLMERLLARAGRTPALDPADLTRLAVALHEGLTLLRLTEAARGGDDSLPDRLLPHLMRVLTA